MSKQLLTLILLLTNIYLHSQNNPQISVDFPGGNIIVDGSDKVSTLYYDIATDTINLRPDLRDTEGKWFYWYFRVTGAEGRRLFFQFPYNVLTSYGPAYSVDHGKTWNWLYENIHSDHDKFSYSFGESEDTVYFSIGIPYLQKDFEKFIGQYASNPLVSLQSLTKSKKGRDIEELQIRNKKITPEYKIIITARHHACEMMANFTLEGIIESVLEDDNDEMDWLREHVEFIIIPFVDKDGVEDGDQGKNRIPRDHNRDYSGTSVHHSTQAIRDKVKSWNGEIQMVGLDLHCPTLKGNWNENVYFVGTEENADQQSRFVDTLLKHHQGLLNLDPTNLSLEYGEAWNTASSYSKGKGFITWMSTLDEVSLAILLELPYANNAGQQVTPVAARSFGKDIAVALAAFLRGKLENN